MLGEPALVLLACHEQLHTDTVRKRWQRRELIELEHFAPITTIAMHEFARSSFQFLEGVGNGEGRSVRRIRRC